MLGELPLFRAGLRVEGWRLVEIAALGLVLCYTALLAVSVGQGLWILGSDGLPVSGDFNAFWAAGNVAVHGNAASAYDWNALAAALERLYPRSYADRYDFFYPPLFFLMLAPLGLLPYLGAAALWIGATLAAYLAAARAILPKRAAIAIALAAPGVLWTISVGQNGLLSAALIGGALATLDRRPLLAGVLIGLLAYKPQFGVLIPFLLIAGGRWRTFAAAGATVILLGLLAGLLFGWNTYSAYLDGFAQSGDLLLDAGAIGWHKMQSVYGLARALGLAGAGAWLAHGFVAIAAALVAIALWRADARFELKAAALPVAALLISPHSCIYDFPIAAIAILFLLRDGLTHPLRPAEKAGLVLAFILPLVFPLVILPVGPFANLIVAAVIVWRWRDVPTRGAGPPLNPLSVRDRSRST